MKKIIVLFICLLFFQIVFANPLTMSFTITGIQGKAKENVIDRLNVEQKNLKPPLTSAQVKNFYKQATVNIQKALEPYGYFRSSVSKSLNLQNNHYEFNFRVTSGPAVKISETNVSLEGPGQYSSELRALVRKAREKLAPGKVLETAKYDKLKQEFFNTAEQQGYLKGFFSTHLIKVNKETNIAAITLIFNTGPRYYFGQVYFSKNPMSISFLRRFLPFHYGEPFSADKLLTLQNNLTGTVYFNQVTVQSNVKKAQNYHIPVNVQLQPAKAQQYSLGLGYGTDTGIRGTYGWQWRRVTTNGHYLQTLLQVSQKRNDSFQAGYIIPGKNPTTDHYALTAGLFTNEVGENNDSYTTAQIGGNYVKLLNGWQRTLSLQYQHENFSISNKDGSVTNTITNTIVPGIAFEKVKANNRINTINGYRVYFHFQGGYIPSNTQANFLQGEFQGKYIRSFNQQNTRLLLTTDLGFTLVKDFEGMPLSQRFFAGGAQTLRGFDFQELGPGRYLIIGQAEWQQRLHGNIYGAVFYNAGNAIQNPPINLEQAAGVGLVYRSPIGPIEITIAHPFNTSSRLNFRDYKIQFTMGPDL